MEVKNDDGSSNVVMLGCYLPPSDKGDEYFSELLDGINEMNDVNYLLFEKVGG